MADEKLRIAEAERKIAAEEGSSYKVKVALDYISWEYEGMGEFIVALGGISEEDMLLARKQKWWDSYPDDVKGELQSMV